MELNQLKSFVTIVNASNFSRAADILHISQPALTHQIRRLEEELGTVLLERGARHVRLTPQGDAFLVYAQRILSLTEECRQTMRELCGGGGRLTIAAGTTNIVFRLANWLQELRQRLPQLEISVQAGSSMEVAEYVLQDQVDLGLVTSPIPDRRLTSHPLFEDKILLIAGKDVLIEENITWQDLKTSSFILFPKGTGFRHYIDDLFRRVGIEPRIAMELDNIEGIKQLTGIGMGLSFLPQIAVEAAISQGILRIVNPRPEMELHRTTSIIMRKGKLWTPAISELIALIAAKYPSSSLPSNTVKNQI
jgi:DNA-binding transcriptional LysR family regulator